MRIVCLGFNFQFLCNMYDQILKINPQTILSTKKSTILAHIQRKY